MILMVYQVFDAQSGTVLSQFNDDCDANALFVAFENYDVHDSDVFVLRNVTEEHIVEVL